MKREILICGVLVVALAALGGCSKKTETAATGTATTTTANAPVSSSGTMELPSRKAGLWEQTIDTEKMHQTISMCLDAAFDQKMKIWGGKAGKTGCTEQKISQHLGGGWTFHAVCPMGESGTVTSDGEVTGDFGSHYKAEVTSTTAGSPMPQANAVRKITVEATWKGPCPATMKPGDMQMPGGMTINMESGTPTVGGAGGVDMAKLRAEAASGHVNPADLAKMRAQAMEMKKQMEAAKQ